VNREQLEKVIIEFSKEIFSPSSPSGWKNGKREVDVLGQKMETEYFQTPGLKLHGIDIKIPCSSSFLQGHYYIRLLESNPAKVTATFDHRFGVNVSAKDKVMVYTLKEISSRGSPAGQVRRNDGELYVFWFSI
jgi:hypothetical protein